MVRQILQYAAEGHRASTPGILAGILAAQFLLKPPQASKIIAIQGGTFLMGSDDALAKEREKAFQEEGIYESPFDANQNKRSKELF